MFFLRRLGLIFLSGRKGRQQQRDMPKPKKVLMGGYTAPGFEKVADTFRENLASGLEQGGSFAVYYQGRPVVNLWGGFCDYDCRRPWKEDTLSTFFSSTKAVGAFVIAHLVDRGLIDYSDRVSKHWPEFSQNGKGEITLQQLVSNQAGLCTLDKPYWLAEMRDDPQGLSKKLAEQKPYWTPGEKHGYHPLTFGLYLDQIVRHVDKNGRSLAQYFKEEIADPFNIELFLGLPKPLTHRATRVRFPRAYGREEYMELFMKNFTGDIDMYNLTNNNAAKDFKSVVAAKYTNSIHPHQRWTVAHCTRLKSHVQLYIGLPKELYHQATRVVMAREMDQSQLLKVFRGDLDLLIKTSQNPQDFKTTLKMNDPDNRELPVPSTHGHATAINMAKLFGIIANGGTADGKTLLSDKVIKKFTEPIVGGYDICFGMNAAWSIGTHLITSVTGNQEPNHIFGHGGYGGQYAASDLQYKIGFAYTTAFLDPFAGYTSEGDTRLSTVLETLYQCVHEIEGVREPRRMFRLYTDFKKYMESMEIPSSKL